MKKVWNILWPYITAAGICVFIVFVHCLTRDIWFFGSKTLLAGDASAQYIYYMSEIWHKIHNGDSLLFTWNMEMGADAYYNMIGYVILPLHIIVWLLPWEWLESSVQLVMVLRFALTAVSIVYYMLHTERNKIKSRKKLIAIVMGVCFACSGIMVNNFVQISWWTAYIVFPLLLLEFEHFIDHGRWKLYYILLVAIIFFNVYIAYTVCVFLVLYFINQEFGSIKVFFKKGIKFALVSLMAVLTSVLAIIPSVSGMFSRYSSVGVTANKTFNYMRLKESVATIWQWINGSYIFSSITDVYDIRPHVYMGLIFPIVIVLYIFIPINRIIKLKRIVMGAIIAGGFLVAPMSYIWHAFVIPNGYYFRFSMLWIFFCVYIFMEEIPYFSEIRLRWVSCAVIAIITLYVMEFFKEEDLREAYVYLIMLLIFVFYVSLIVLHRRRSISTGSFLTVLSIITLIEIIANGYVLFQDVSHSSIANVAYNKYADDLVGKVDVSNGERVMMTNTDMDYGLWKGTNSVNGFASISNHGILRLLTQLGLSQFASENGGDCRGGTPLINFILNVKYGVGLYEGAFSDVIEVDNSDELKLYEMNHPVYMGYLVEDNILNWDVEENELFEGQNDFVKKALNMDAFMTVLPRTGVVQVDYGYLNEQENGDYNFIVTEDNTGVMLSYIVPNDMDLYIYTFANKNYGFRQLKVDGEIVFNDFEYRTIGTIHVGEVKKGQKVTLMQILNGYMGEEATFRYQIASFDKEKYEEIYEKLTESVYNVQQFKDTYIKGNINARKDGIMMTSVPAKDGFTVYVDGKKTEFKTVANAFIGVPISAGEHVVEFRYMTPLVIEGAVFSCIGVVIFIIVCICEGRIQKKVSG